MSKKKIEIIPQRGIVIENHVINIGNKIDDVIIEFESYDMARDNEFYFINNNIHVIVDKSRIIRYIEVYNDDNYEAYVGQICITSTNREVLIDDLSKINGNNPSIGENDSLNFNNIGLSLWFESSIEDAESVIEDMKEEGVYTKEKAEYEMKLANFYGSIVIY